MTAPILLPLFSAETLIERLATALGSDIGRIETRQFPDGETYLKIDAPVAGRAVAIVSALDRPDPKFLPLLFAADAARDLGAASVGLIAPYLAYMRQDKRFHAGEAVTSRTFARSLSMAFDWLVTIDPHLHRYKSLAELYTIPTEVLHAGFVLADWIAKNVASPILIGPDAESEQWVADVAHKIGAPFIVLEKRRKGDRDVEIRVPADAQLGGRTPVLLDDIIASGETMLQGVRAIRRLTPQRPVCVAVHGIFAEGAEAALVRENARIVTSNTVPHETNAMDVSALLAQGVAATLAGL